MTQRTDEELIEEFKRLHCTEHQGVFLPATKTAEGQIDWLRTVLAERPVPCPYCSKTGNPHNCLRFGFAPAVKTTTSGDEELVEEKKV